MVPDHERLQMAKSEGAERLWQVVFGWDQLEPHDCGGQGVFAAPAHQRQGVCRHAQQPQQLRHLSYLIELLLQLSSITV